MEKEYTFRTDESEYQYYMSDIGEEAGSFTIRGTVRDFTPETLETLCEYLDEKNAQNGFTNSDPTAFEALQEMDSALYDSVIAAADALADSKTYVQSLEFASSELLEEIWEKIGEIDKFYGDRLADINWVASSLLEFMNYVSGIFSRPDPISFLENSRSFEVVVDEMTAQIRERRYSAAKDYILKSTEGDVSQELETAIAGLEAMGYTQDEIIAALYSVQNGYDLTLLVYLAAADYEKAFSIYPSGVSDELMGTLALHAVILARHDEEYGKGSYPLLEGFVNGIADTRIMNNDQYGLIGTGDRAKYRDIYLQRIYVQTMQFVYADAMSLATALSLGLETWEDEHEKLMAIAGLWGHVYAVRTDKSVHNYLFGNPDCVSISNLQYDAGKGGFTYSAALFGKGPYGLAVEHASVEVAGRSYHTPGGLERAVQLNVLSDLDFEASRLWLSNIDSVLGSLSTINPKSKLAYQTLKYLVSMADDSVSLNDTNKLVSAFDKNKNFEAATFLVGLYVTLYSNAEAGRKLDSAQQEAMKKWLNTWCGSGFGVTYGEDEKNVRVVYGEPYNVYSLAGIMTWMDCEEGIRFLYPEGTEKNDAVRKAFEAVQVEWEGKDPDSLSPEQRFILYGQGGLKRGEMEELDWVGVESLLDGVSKYCRTETGITIDFLEGVARHYREGEGAELKDE